MKESENILRILEETKIAISKKDIIRIKDLSNQTIHTASISQDPDNIAIAVIVYSLSKIIERKQSLQEYKRWDLFYKIILSSIDGAISSIKEKNEKNFQRHVRDIQKAVNKLSGKLRKYIQDVFEKASINKASRIYEHGISMEKTASLLGITMYDLANYSGQTGISDAPLGKTVNVKSRIKFAMSLFK